MWQTAVQIRSLPSSGLFFNTVQIYDLVNFFVCRMIWQQTAVRCCLLLMILLITGCHGYDWSGINLPLQHVPFFFKNNPSVRELCEKDEQCPHKVNGNDTKVRCFELFVPNFDVWTWDLWCYLLPVWLTFRWEDRSSLSQIMVMSE